MSAAEIRPANAADLPLVTGIYAHAVLYGTATFELIPPDLAEMTRRFDALKHGGFPYFVAVLDGRVIGYAYAGPYRPRSAYRYTVEDSIYLAPAATGRGIGSRLLAAVIEGATRAGKRQMLAVIGDSANTASIALHRRLGFTSVGTFQSVGFKFQRWVDSVLMQRALGQGDGTAP